MKMRNVLVIGGSGFIGANLIRKLNQKGESVTSFDQIRAINMFECVCVLNVLITLSIHNLTDP